MEDAWTRPRYDGTLSRVTRTLTLVVVLVALEAFAAYGFWMGHNKTGEWRFLPSGPLATSTSRTQAAAPSSA
jgi:hypothetical protein